MEDVPGDRDVLTLVWMTLRAAGGLWATSIRTRGGVKSVTLVPFLWSSEERRHGAAE